VRIESKNGKILRGVLLAAEEGGGALITTSASKEFLGHRIIKLSEEVLKRLKCKELNANGN
jgi:hypothetical protein